MKKKLKLFVWTEFCPDWTSGLAFAIAKDETEARRLVIEAYDCEPSDWGKLEIRPLNKKTAECVSGGGFWRSIVP